MSTQSISLFQALGAKMDFLSQRQVLINQNVANADTPGYKPRDLKDMDFGKILGDINKNASNGVQQVSLGGTAGKHIGASASGETAKVEKQRETYEATLSGNSVVLEEQLVKSNQNNMDYNLMANLYQKNVGLIRTAIGSNR